MKPPLIVALEYACREMRGFCQRLDALQTIATKGNGSRMTQDLASGERDRLTDLEGEVRFEGYEMNELARRMEQILREYYHMSERARRERSLPASLPTSELEMRITLQLDI